MVNKGTLLVIPDGLISNRTKDLKKKEKQKKRKEKERKYAQLQKGLY